MRLDGQPGRNLFGNSPNSAVESHLHSFMAEMHVRLTRKLANALNGLDLRQYVVGEVLDLPESFARMLIEENWAEPVIIDLATAADRPPRKRH